MVAALHAAVLVSFLEMVSRVRGCHCPGRGGVCRRARFQPAPGGLVFMFTARGTGRGFPRRAGGNLRGLGTTTLFNSQGRKAMPGEARVSGGAVDTCGYWCDVLGCHSSLYRVQGKILQVTQSASYRLFWNVYVVACGARFPSEEVR